jgi:hypothetical protein
MTDLEARFVRFADLKKEKRRIELELRLEEIDRELELITPHWDYGAAPGVSLQAA